MGAAEQHRYRGPRIGVWAADPITSAGLLALLPIAGFDPVPGADLSEIDALLVATETDSVNQSDLLTAAADVDGLPVIWLHQRHDPDGLTRSTVALSVMRPGDARIRQVGEALLGSLLRLLRDDHSSSEQEAASRASSAPAALSEIECSVLRLLAEGRDTAEIAAQLFYSERTVKNAISRATHALGAANRPSAVAAALRSGYL